MGDKEKLGRVGLLLYGQSLPLRTIPRRRRKGETDADQKAWIDKARQAFNRNIARKLDAAQQVCSVCRHPDGVEAHHLFPLPWQFEQDWKEPDQSFVWLCRIHHTAVHQVISTGEPKKHHQKRELMLIRRIAAVAMLDESNQKEAS